MKRISICVFLLIISVLSFADQATQLVNAKDRIAVRGYDVVAYFKDAKATKGDKQIQHKWNGATWYFANESNRDLFAKDPQKYAPQFGGYCAYAASKNYIYDADPEFWKIVDGKLYLNYNGDAKKIWEQDIPGNIKKGNENWPDLMKKERK
ncbi:YHS domain protein [bacterium]|nr:YHS domain protein [bacterium]MCI0606520.1 YHS domain protein [bacterium]